MTETTFDRYALGQRIGSGGMGDVYRGLDRLTNTPVAIKVLKSELATQEMVQRFVREGEALRQLNHPNIVKLLDTVNDDARHYLIMELVEGGALDDLLRQTPRLPMERILNIALDMADALTRAHRLNIIHRDIKPANVLLTHDGILRLTDFGIARFDGSTITQTDIVLGTLAYIAPEVLTGTQADARSDIWSLGLMLFEMVAGEHPFKLDQHPGGLIQAVLEAQFPDLETMRPDAPPALVDLIYRMVMKDPAERIPRMRLVGAELEAILANDAETLPELPTEATLLVVRIEPNRRFETSTDSALEAQRSNLPASTTPFVGREHELAELETLTRDPTIRLMTVLAPGGMGKTRLALETGKMALGLFKNGVYFVDLTPLTNPGSIVSALAEAIQYVPQPGADPKDQVLAFLANRQMLLILDNFEHLIEGSSLVTELLHAAPQVKVVVTSRARLNQSGETLFHLGGMDFPDWETPEDALTYAAVKLFMQSARRVQPGFDLTVENMHYVARICKLVQGMPLGILLAASWLGILTVAEIAAEIARDVDFLASDLSDLPERQQSIRAVFDYSWKLMTVAEQQVFMKLSLFRSGFTREAAQAVTGASLQVLSSLVNKSLIQRTTESGRFGIHELLRQYAEQKLAESDAIVATHHAYLEYFTVFLRNRYLDVQWRRQLAATEELKIETNNIRQAWQMAIDRRDTARLAIMASTWALHVGNEPDFVADLSMLRQAVDTLEPETPEWDWIACMHEFLSTVTSTLTPDYRFSEQILQRARASNHRKLLMLSLLTRGCSGMFAGEPSAFPLLQEGIALAAAPEDTYYRVRMGTMPMGLGLVLSGQLEAGYAQLKAASEEAGRMGDFLALAILALADLPFSAIALNHHPEAVTHIERAIDVVQSASDKAMFRWVKAYFVAYLAFLEGDYESINALNSELRQADFHGLWYLQARNGILGLIPDSLGGDATQLQAIIAPFEKFGPLYSGTLIWCYWLAALAACVNANFGGVRIYLAKMRQVEQMSGYVAPEHPTLATVILALEARQRDEQQRSVELLGLAFETAKNSRGMYTNWPFLAAVRSELRASLGEEAYIRASERGKSLVIETVIQEFLDQLDTVHGRSEYFIASVNVLQCAGLWQCN